MIVRYLALLFFSCIAQSGVALQLQARHQLRQSGWTNCVNRPWSGKPVFAADGEAAESSLVSENESQELESTTYVNLGIGKGGEESTPAWKDPAPSANTDFTLSWWAYALVLYPAVLLSNDFLHWVPEGTPLPGLK
uniref:Uncharacterized protein n=1 Tax=Octactis speculum TaxID=3111310 RepID=A0A7S2FBE9_9STRA